MIEIKAKTKKNGEVFFVAKNQKNKRSVLIAKYLNGETKKGEGAPLQIQTQLSLFTPQVRENNLSKE